MSAGQATKTEINALKQTDKGLYASLGIFLYTKLIIPNHMGDETRSLWWALICVSVFGVFLVQKRENTDQKNSEYGHFSGNTVSWAP